MSCNLVQVGNLTWQKNRRGKSDREKNKIA